MCLSEHGSCRFTFRIVLETLCELFPMEWISLHNIFCILWLSGLCCISSFFFFSWNSGKFVRRIHTLTKNNGNSWKKKNREESTWNHEQCKISRRKLAEIIQFVAHAVWKSLCVLSVYAGSYHQSLRYSKWKFNCAQKAIWRTKSSQNVIQHCVSTSSEISVSWLFIFSVCHVFHMEWRANIVFRITL